ncbi:hypothetical protein Scep_000640 [Stephania cephalantha]|uniref:Ubiquitin-conjugating enzyme E2C-binding protein n=1 Tax=Stephania cephalantha TaxID=152367 RepID=A0AAP0LAL4_9MAGN
MSAFENPRKWRYTWETLAHIPTLRLYLFNPDIKPSNQCNNLDASLNSDRSLLLISWIEEHGDRIDGSADRLLQIPVPRVLIDLGSPLDFRAAVDHIEVKLLLVLPVDHPLSACFYSVLDLSDESCDGENAVSDRSRWFSADSDLKRLSSGGGVHFHCKNCSVKLTKSPLRSFVQMPSADWREVADNWFGTCCCSFGGISEKLVTKYASCYFCEEGTCLLDAASVIVSTVDLAEDVFPDCLDSYERCGSGYYQCVKDDRIIEVGKDSESNCRDGLYNGNGIDEISDVFQTIKIRSKDDCALDLKSAARNAKSEGDTSFCTTAMPNFSGSQVYIDGDLDEDGGLKGDSPQHAYECCSHHISTASKNHDSTLSIKLESQKSFLNGFLGNGFMIRTSNFSKEVNWINYRCTHCSAFLGAYPSDINKNAPLDGGVRFFKCNISTSLPVGASDDIFKKYTLDGMFVDQLMETAKDELSFRTLVRDLETRSPMLKVVLLNSKVCSSSGICKESDSTKEALCRIDLQPVAKVLFADCRGSSEDQLRSLEEWVTKNEADEVYMLSCQAEELIESLKSSHNKYPLSFSFMQGLWLSSMAR